MLPTGLYCHSLKISQGCQAIEQLRGLGGLHEDLGALGGVEAVHASYALAH